MVWSPLLTIHIFGGIVGFLSGSMAMVVPKGGRLHRRSGDVFVLAMLSMAASGGVLAMVRGQGVNVVAGLFTFYLVTSAWLTVRHKERETGPGEVALLVMALAIALGAWIARWNAAHHAAGLKSGDSAAYFIFGLLTLACAAGDARMLVRGGVSGARRLVRHVWRMGFALFIATASFFLGRAGDPVLRRRACAPGCSLMPSGRRTSRRSRSTSSPS
jgi:Predicted membrane protein